MTLSQCVRKAIPKGGVEVICCVPNANGSTSFRSCVIYMTQYTNNLMNTNTIVPPLCYPSPVHQLPSIVCSMMVQSSLVQAIKSMHLATCSKTTWAHCSKTTTNCVLNGSTSFRSCVICMTQYTNNLMSDKVAPPLCDPSC